MSKMTLTTEGERHVVVTRRFAAPPEAVYRAHTEPKLIQKWLLGPDGWTMPVCVNEARPGGKRVVKIDVGLFAQAVDQFAGLLLVDVGFDQIGEDVEQRRRHAVRGRCRAGAELLDDRLKFGELEVEAGGRGMGEAS